MTRSELLADARRLVPFAVGCFALAAALWPGADEQPGRLLVIFLALTCGGFAFSSALYFLVAALRRSADWKPGAAELAMKGFDAEKARDELRRMISAELPGALIEITDEPLDNPVPEDTGSGWRRLFISSRVIHEQHVVRAKIPAARREIIVSAYYGRKLSDPKALWARLTLDGRCAPPKSARAPTPTRRTRSSSRPT